MMKRLVVLVLCALVVGCGGGSSSGKMAMDSLEETRTEPPRTELPRTKLPRTKLPRTENAEARVMADAIDGSSTYIEREERSSEAESYEITKGILTHTGTGTAAVEITNEGTSEIINIFDWDGLRYKGIHKTAEYIENNIQKSETITDKFVIYTKSNSLNNSGYMDFGYWLNEVSVTSEGQTTVTTFVDGFVFGSSVSDEILLNRLDRGRADYSGPATGVFAKEKDSIYDSSGQFKAKTVLEVEFGIPGGNDPDKDTVVKISGRVTDFRDIDDKIIDSDWKVELLEVEHFPSGYPMGKKYDGGKTDGGATDEMGNDELRKWDFQFYGELEENNPMVQPAIIGGGFDATFPNGKVAGAFAATKD